MGNSEGLHVLFYIIVSHDVVSVVFCIFVGSLFRRSRFYHCFQFHFYVSICFAVLYLIEIILPGSFAVGIGAAAGLGGVEFTFGGSVAKRRTPIGTTLEIKSICCETLAVFFK